MKSNKIARHGSIPAPYDEDACKATNKQRLEMRPCSAAVSVNEQDEEEGEDDVHEVATHEVIDEAMALINQRVGQKK
jgi:hypothetical protein